MKPLPSYSLLSTSRFLILTAASFRRCPAGKPRGYVVIKSASIPMESERCPVNGLAAVEEGITPPGRPQGRGAGSSGPAAGCVRVPEAE